MTTFHAYAATRPGGPLEPFSYDPGPLRHDEVEIEVDYCGICHSDLSMLDNAWKISRYPFVPGHEAIGRIATLGETVNHLSVGQTVGLGWIARSCLTCRLCQGGDLNLCADSVGSIVGRHGGFADRVRCQANWALPLPDGLDASTAGPLFCGGITVFNPIVRCGVLPTHRVGVVGIGGLGHLALQFLSSWGCEVTAFSTTPEKESEALTMGAHHFVDSRDSSQLENQAGKLDFILVTVNAALPWEKYIAALAPRGRIHLVGAAPSIETAVFPLIGGEKSIGGSPVGSPAMIADMLDFCARHAIAPITQHYPMNRVNDALERLRSGEARYRLVLENA
ncbi:MAG: NAD(P)-dependent alcohol dehydrogenase [Xanthomonadales bacterium]|nr:NAD(P)-dependent alcohol dehydrogenase [Xanthomonadales bacterium]